MNPFTEVNDEFTQYFKSRGVDITWDFNKRTGVHWYELCDEKGIVCQVDFGTPLNEFLTDIPHFLAGRGGVGPSDYECSCPDANLDRLRAIYEKVNSNEKQM